ncbi:MAG: hypothetical protein RSD40_04355 [Bacilli bacterium]|jgi:hypothetical protein
MSYPILELPDIFVLSNKYLNFIYLNQFDADIFFIEDEIGIKIFGNPSNSLGTIVIEILQRKNALGEHVYKITSHYLREYYLTQSCLLQIKLANLDSMYSH